MARDGSANVRSFMIRRCIPIGVLLSLSIGQAIAADKVTLQLSWLPQGQASALYYGIEQNCFGRENIDLTVQRGYGNSDTVNKIVTKAADFGQLDLGSLIVAREKNRAPIKAVMPLFSDAPLAIGVLGDSPVRAMKDLEGRTIAMGPGEGGALLVPIAMRNEGADVAKVKMSTIEPSALAGSLLQKRVDGIVTYVTTAAGIDTIAKKVGQSVRSIPFGKDLGIYGDTFIASDDLIAANPDLVGRFRKAIGCAYKGAHGDPDAAIKAMLSRIPEMDAGRELVLAKMGWTLVFDSTSQAFVWDDAKLKRTAELTAASQDLPSVPDPSGFIAR